MTVVLLLVDSFSFLLLSFVCCSSFYQLITFHSDACHCGDLIRLIVFCCDESKSFERDGLMVPMVVLLLFDLTDEIKATVHATVVHTTVVQTTLHITYRFFNFLLLNRDKLRKGFLIIEYR